MFRRLKNFWCAKKFNRGDRVMCPCCGTVFTLVKFQGNKFPKGYEATVKVKVKTETEHK